MFQVVSPPIIRSSKNVHTALGKCQACLVLPLAWVSWLYLKEYINDAPSHERQTDCKDTLILTIQGEPCGALRHKVHQVHPLNVLLPQHRD